jgi:hypothetical protein
MYVRPVSRPVMVEAGDVAERLGRLIASGAKFQALLYR